MSVLTRYLVLEILKDAGIALLLLLTLFNLFTFGDELDDIGKGSYGLPQVFEYMALTSPAIFYQLMPASALVGSLFALGGLANHHELTAMRAAGVSVFAIIKATLLAGVILAGVAVLVGEFVAPDAEQKAQLIKATRQKGQVVLRTRYGLWLREGKQFINIHTIDDQGDLLDVEVYEVDDQQRLNRYIQAAQASYQGKKRWLLQQVRQTDISTQQVSATSQPEQLWQSSIDPDILKIAVVTPNNLSLYDLAMYVQFLKENQQKSHIFEMAFWGRITNPLVIFVMLLVSTPFVIGVKRGIGAGARILIGAVIGLGFNVFDMTVSHLGLIYELSPPVVAFIPSMTMLIAALLAIKRVR